MRALALWWIGASTSFYPAYVPGLQSTMGALARLWAVAYVGALLACLSDLFALAPVQHITDRQVGDVLDRGQSVLSWGMGNGVKFSRPVAFGGALCPLGR